MSISIISLHSLLKERKRFPHWRGGCLKNTRTFHKITNPHPNNLPQSTSYLLPDPNKASTIKLDPIKINDSAVNICSLNIRSLTIKEDSIKLKRLFKLDAAVIVLTEVCMNGSDYNRLCRYWREQISRYQVWYTSSDYRGIMILILKNSGCYFENEQQINNNAVLVDFFSLVES